MRISLLRPTRATCFAHLILFDLITLINLVKSTDQTTPIYAISSTPILPRPSETQMSHSVPYSNIFSVCFS
jgi:hypothetical protein